MVKIWSQAIPSRVAWKISLSPAKEKYASAFSPPSVSIRNSPKCTSRGSGWTMDPILETDIGCSVSTGASGALEQAAVTRHMAIIAMTWESFTGTSKTATSSHKRTTPTTADRRLLRNCCSFRVGLIAFVAACNRPRMSSRGGEHCGFRGRCDCDESRLAGSKSGYGAARPSRVSPSEIFGLGGLRWRARKE